MTITVGAGAKVVWHSTFPGGASNSNRASSTFGAQSAAKTQTVTHKDTIYELNLNATNDLNIRRVGETTFINGIPFDPNTHANLIVSSRPANGSFVTRAVLTI